MKIIISIPALNEERTIPRVIREIKSEMDKTSYKGKYSVLVYDDGSTDATSGVAKKSGAIVRRNKRNLGLAETFKKEMAECIKLKADVIVHTDADGQYPAKYIPKMVKLIEDGCDLVIGSRFDKGDYSGSFAKKMGNIAFAHVFSNLLKTRITDTTSGFRAFTREVAEIPLINTFTYTQEQLLRAGRNKMMIREIHITTRKTRPSRLFSGPIDYAFKAWINILRIYRDFEPLKFFGQIGLMSILLGLLLGLYIVGRIVFIGNSGGVPRVVLSMLLIMLGVQVALFGFLADMNRK